MNKIKLEIVGLSYSQTQSGAYALVLGEVNGRRRLPIIIGGFEAQAIAIEIEKLTPSRPLTHDLFKTFASTFGISIHEVIIYNLVDGIFYAKLICNNGKKDIEIDARTSDAIALAIRFDCPIYTYEFILASAGIVIEGNDFVFLENLETPREEQSTAGEGSKTAYASYTDDELKAALQQALQEEAYEKAAKIRDEISRRKSS
ncbi:bifunctional nuclease domain-containing protein [Olivibacter sp. CPCC 100613]|uniref:bifunctional nuclease family protein n=1 Tax=Olivibacter sp. CPCC 100613 TaxID=3079931 RepID=UPI002FF65C5C